MWLERPVLRDLLAALTFEAFSPLGLALAVLGLLWPSGGRAASIFRLWSAGAGLFLFLCPEILPGNHYYFTLLLPAGAALAGIALARLASFNKLQYVPALIMLVFAAGAIHGALPFYEGDGSPYDVGKLINRLSAPDDLIVTESGGNPNVLYYADRRGWMLEKIFDPYALERWSKRGARYYADTSMSDPNAQPEFFGKLDARFDRLTAEDKTWPWPIYQLTPRIVPAEEHPSQDRRIDFGTRIELQGFFARELLATPASFEFVYDWRCLQRIASDLRVFVRITGSDGQAVYQQDHWPLNGHSKTSQWNPGDSIQERYVVVIPMSIPAGKYEVRVGWSDNTTGRRLPIANPTLDDKDDGARVASINVKAPPNSGWFRQR